MPERNLQDANGYRYAYQGQEKDPETGKEAFQLRLWDSRIGRWLTTDPYGQYSSPYLGMGNNPINLIDPDGGATIPQHTLQGINDLVGDLTFFANGVGGFDNFWEKVNFHGLKGVTVNAYSLKLNDAGFSTNPNITIDHIVALEKGRPSMSNIEAIILHRTVSSNYPGAWMKKKNKIKGTHFYIDKDGTTYQTASLNKSTAHLWSSNSQMYPEYYKKLLNTNTVGIEVIGNYNKKDKIWEPLTARQVDATSLLVNQLKSHYNIHSNKIYPHEKVQKKTAGEGQTVLDAINLD